MQVTKRKNYLDELPESKTSEKQSGQLSAAFEFKSKMSPIHDQDSICSLRRPHLKDCSGTPRVRQAIVPYRKQ
jgi:hypothetical protein